MAVTEGLSGYRYLVAGAGLSGATVARRIAEDRGDRVLVVDRRPHTGGNCRDFRSHGITVHAYGPHVFHTSIQRVWDFLSRFTQWHPFFYRVRAVIDGNEVNIPFNLDSLYKCFPPSMALMYEKKLLENYAFGTRIVISDLLSQGDPDLKELARFVYEKVFLGYSMKQWGKTPEELDISVSGRVPILISRDSRYFQDRYSAIPLHGYSAMIGRILDHPNITVLTSTQARPLVDEGRWDRVYWTGAIDEFFGYSHGALPYRSLDIRYQTLDLEYYQSCAQINFPCDHDFTRCVEYKHYLSEKSDKTIISREYAMDFEDGVNERFYPIENEGSRELYGKYAREAEALERVTFLGRLGLFKYMNMDQVTDRALDLF